LPGREAYKKREAEASLFRVKIPPLPSRKSKMRQFSQSGACLPCPVQNNEGTYWGYSSCRRHSLDTVCSSRMRS